MDKSLYRTSIKRCVWLLIAGTTLQLLLGSVRPDLLRYPWGEILGLVFLFLLIAVHAFGKKWVRNIAGTHSASVSLAFILLLLLFFGLIRQDGRTEGLWGILGFTKMQYSWIFILQLLYFTSIVTLNAIEDIHHFRRHSIGTSLSHISMSLVLLCGLFGSRDTSLVEAGLWLFLAAGAGMIIFSLRKK